jgi:hypothetical protein
MAVKLLQQTQVVRGVRVAGAEASQMRNGFKAGLEQTSTVQTPRGLLAPRADYHLRIPPDHAECDMNPDVKGASRSGSASGVLACRSLARSARRPILYGWSPLADKTGPAPVCPGRCRDKATDTTGSVLGGRSSAFRAGLLLAGGSQRLPQAALTGADTADGTPSASTRGKGAC